MQSREGVKGQLPLAKSRGSASGGVWGNAPTVFRALNSKKTANKRRRQRSVPASNFARPQTRPQANLANYYALSRQMGATTLPAASTHNPPKNLHKSPQYDRIPPDKGD